MPAARACHLIQFADQDLYSGAYLQTYASTIEEDAFVGCVSGVALPVHLTDTIIPAPAEHDIGERVLDRVGRPFYMPTNYYNLNITSGNVCMSGGACLYTTQAPVQTVLVLLSTAPQQDNGVYISTRQGGLAVF